MKKVFIILTIAIFSCTGEIDFPDGSPVMVVEGWVTSEEKQHWVKLSKTVGFQNSKSEEPIVTATVTIQDNVMPAPYILTHSENGVYLADSFSGIIGRRYVLTIVLSNGDVITSESERLNPVPNIQEINFDSFIEQDPETGEDTEIFFPIVTTTDPINETNFYRYKGFRNNQLLNTSNELEILNDQFINGQELPHNIPSFRYSLGDNSKIELHSLSKSAFSFFELLKSQTTSLGSSSGTAPATLVGNLAFESKNDLVLGFFGASDVKSISSTAQ